MIRLLSCLAALLALTACNTVRGAGQDIQSAGQAISSTASETQSKL
ncbi:entericidin A/B family lipoprotein [Pseudooceanicola sp. HF7]|nr:entericidin A/B family lipoprotein [Pseudooceanicola sp. HF7]NIZ08563.1 entericidin A/B family lipoprotein [Pseudooceanicola sp. HF7]